MEAHQVGAAGDVNLEHAAEIERGEELDGVKAVIDGVGVDVVQIEQQGAAGPRSQLVEELGFGEFLVLKREVVDVVFQQEGTARGDPARPSRAG